MWNICLRLFLLTTVFLSVVTHAQRDIFQIPRRNPNDKIRACGRNLSNMLHEVCGGVYNPLFAKKSVKEPDTEYWWNEPSSVEEQLPYPLKALSKTSSFLNSSNRRQKRQGIYDECCRKACAYSELRSYCGS